jgi:hypothetical protein
MTPSMKALDGASKSLLRINEHGELGFGAGASSDVRAAVAGVLSLHHLVKASDGTSSVIEFTLLPSGDDQDEMDVGGD